MYVFLSLCLFSLCLIFKQGSRAFGNPSSIFSGLFYSNCLCLGLFFLDSVFAGFQNWTSSPWHWRLTHFSWQTLSLKVYYWAIHHEGQGHKSSSCIQPNYCLWNVKISVSCWHFTHLYPDLFYLFKVHCCCFYGPCPALPFTAILFIMLDPNYKSPLVPTSPLFPPTIPIHTSHPNIQVIRKSLMELPDP